MRRILLLSFTLLLALTTLSAQKPVIKFSPEMKMPRDKDFRGHLYSDSSGHYIYFYEGRSNVKMILEKYDQKFKQKFSKEFAAGNDNISSLGVSYFKGQFAWLVMERNSKEDFIRYALTPISLDGKASKPVTLAKFNYERRRDIPSIRWEPSQDTTKMMFSAMLDNNSDERDFETYVSVVDKDFNKVWEQKFKLPYTEEQVSASSWAVNDKGDVFLLAKVYEGNSNSESKRDKSKGKRVPNYNMRLFRFSQGTKEAVEFELSLKDAFIKGATLEISKNGDVNCLGFFANERRGATRGVFLMRLSGADGSVSLANKRSFTEEDLDILGNSNTQKDKDGEEGISDEFKFEQVVLSDDGSIFLTAEENFVVTRSYYNGRTWQTVTTYYSNDIVVVSINPAGEVTRLTLIPKRQAFGSPTFESFATLVTPKAVHFFYNDDVDNLKKPFGSRPKYISSFRDCVATMTTLSGDAKPKRRELFGKDDVDQLFIPGDSHQYSANDMFFITMKFKILGKNEFRMGTVSVE